LVWDAACNWLADGRVGDCETSPDPISFRADTRRAAIRCSRTIFTSSIWSLKNKGFCNPVISSLYCPLLRFAAATSLTSLRLVGPDRASAMLSEQHRRRVESPLRRSFRGWLLSRSRRCGGSIRCRARRAWCKTSAEGAYATICAPNRTNRKQRGKTMACEKNAITAACYLCNTLPKTVVRTPFRAVPLLRVQKPSVIVMLRRRGASRGRPVFRWFA
jgi:hypothetical protein